MIVQVYEGAKPVTSKTKGTSTNVLNGVKLLHFAAHKQSSRTFPSRAIVARAAALARRSSLASMASLSSYPRGPAPSAAGAAGLVPKQVPRADKNHFRAVDSCVHLKRQLRPEKMNRVEELA